MKYCIIYFINFNINENIFTVIDICSVWITLKKQTFKSPA
jgi:hypothetical protein